MRICTVTGNKEKGVKIMPRPYLGDPKYTIEVLQKYNFAFQKMILYWRLDRESEP